MVREFERVAKVRRGGLRERGLRERGLWERRRRTCDEEVRTSFRGGALPRAEGRSLRSTTPSRPVKGEPSVRALPRSNVRNVRPCTNGEKKKKRLGFSRKGPESAPFSAARRAHPPSPSGNGVLAAARAKPPANDAAWRPKPRRLRRSVRPIGRILEVKYRVNLPGPVRSKA